MSDQERLSLALHLGSPSGRRVEVWLSDGRSLTGRVIRYHDHLLHLHVGGSDVVVPLSAIVLGEVLGEP